MILQRLSTYIVISAFFVWTSILLKSDFLSTFLLDNIVVIIITLLAINTATYGFIISKIDEISKDAEIDFFEEATGEIKKSLKCQLYLIAASILVLILDSSVLITETLEIPQFVFDFLLVFIFVFSLDLLRDTGFAIFELRNPKNKKDGQQE